MKKKSNTARLGALALALTMVTTCLTGGTMAKYVTTVLATGSATVAKFDVDIKGNGTEFGSEIKDLFTSGWKAPVGNGVKENMLAPGVYGYFDIVVENKSEVMVKISKVEINVENSKSIPIKFAMGTTDSIMKPENFDVEEKELSSEIKGVLGEPEINWITKDDANKKSVRVWWTWKEDASHDEADTVIGSYGTGTPPTYGLTIFITAEQVVSTSTPTP